VGSSGRHRHADGPKTLRPLLIAAAALAAIALGAITVAISGSGSSSAQTASRAAPGSRDPLNRASRDALRTPVATPDPEPSESPSETPRKKPRHRITVLSRGACEASYYGTGGRTASGEAFDPAALTAAHRTLPLGSKVRVTNRNNDRSVVVRINDRGPFVAGRCLDLSTAAMQAVKGTGSGVIPVSYEVIRTL
jgi:rare lipoprotein A